MPIDPAAIGTTLPPVEMTVDAARLRFFAKAIGETNPIYLDSTAAAAAGHPALPVPPTFLFSIELGGPDPFPWISDLGVDLRFVLHGEQAFTYHSTAHAGDTLVATSTISDIYSKKGGALEFVVKDTAVTRVDGSAVADLRTVIVVRNPGVRQ
ncbi:MaoC family dehydratase N-terminal domain-containing protein [Rhodococcus sp. IEGM 1354]|uniref:MaoC family dehydratase N-terminal domain-containing protein n=1 Tax=Rhodococcus sp. IEGM 1354 TaxID=3047088 RepID=UPI0024B6D59A|nr:MaoC family dehydratase N-terminal domain-containing protein [Rhodococcus sp. IEGM 1354]MDI9933656.1 MaoC family dehydratase N-terminal domain-containing protein [Rhodococcus sp. IEGM 1354]